MRPGKPCEHGDFAAERFALGFVLNSQDLIRCSMCGWTCLMVILAAIAVGAASGSDQKSFQQHAALSLMPAQRAFDNTNSTGNLIFWSINSLLQVWPNGRYTAGTVTLQLTSLQRVDDPR